jgi:DNA replicative helicase MCM subunit Mcm2 (Cdc46/Mcm family)
VGAIDMSEELNYEYMKNNIFSNIYGYDKIKDALMLLLVSNKPFHILLVSDPGLEKSQLLRDVAAASNGLYFRDYTEIETIPDDTKVVCINNFEYAPIDETLMYNQFNSKHSIFMAVVTKFGRLDPYEALSRQISVPGKILNEFSLIFTLRDLPNRIKDEKTADNILSGVDIKTDPSIVDKLRSLREINPVLSDEAKLVIKNYYIKVRADLDDMEYAIQITSGQINTLVHVSECFAKYKNSDVINADDANKATELLSFMLSQIGIKKDEECEPSENKLSIYERLKADVDDGIYAIKKKAQEKYDLSWEEARNMTNQSVIELYEFDVKK